MSEPTAEAKEILRLAKDAAAKIRELACSVQIFITMHDSGDGSTKHMTHGLGNWYAREGQVREWVIENEERIKALSAMQARRDAEADEDEQ
jgi:hypothetical protein